jgi:DNA (cytosine-5)-methyltransferase 1
MLAVEDSHHVMAPKTSTSRVVPTVLPTGLVSPFAEDAPVEHFEVDASRKWIVRHVRVGRQTRKSRVLLAREAWEPGDLRSTYDASWLRSKEAPQEPRRADRVRIVDMFSGCGGLSLGVAEACRAMGLVLEHALAVDTNPDALAVYARNFPGVRASQDDITSLFGGELGEKATNVEKKRAREIGELDFLVGGPPCQGHSSLNNHTRRADPRNSLYLRMARCAEVLKPRHILIENVPGVVHDKSGVVQETSEALARLGYRVSSHVIKTLDLGVPQNRRRHLLVATKARLPELKTLTDRYGVPPRSFAWACGELARLKSDAVFDSAAVHSDTNQSRIDYLFDHDLYDLPNAQRPDCHRLKDHSYNAVYGRLRLDEPVPTITRGFGSTGQGRFVHPSQRRSLTPHEAARIQFFPDFFTFGSVRRYALQIIIGNAVPSKLSYAVGLELLREDGHE